MKRVFVPTEFAGDWQNLLAQRSHWQRGRSAMTTAACWKDEIKSACNISSAPELTNLELLFAAPEWEVPLEGGSRPSFTDLVAIARNDRGLVAIAIEAKVDEDFGPTVGQKRMDASEGQTTRLDCLSSLVGLPKPKDTLRYQLLHRTASAILIARQFHAATAVMLVQSFSTTHARHEDYAQFCDALGVSGERGRVWRVPGHTNPALFIGWVTGAARYLDVQLDGMVVS